MPNIAKYYVIVNNKKYKQNFKTKRVRKFYNVIRVSNNMILNYDEVKENEGSALKIGLLFT